MENSVKKISGFAIGATDGEIGKITEFYFDDETWTIRYAVVKTGGWLSGRKVLISPRVLQSADWENKVFPATLTRDQVEHSPDIDTEKTVSRQQEIELYEHYAWPYYSAAGAGFYDEMGVPTLTDYLIPMNLANVEDKQKEASGDPHLRGTREVTGYQIHASDGKIGEVEDFIIDDHSWMIRYLVVDTGNWFPGKKVILAPEWITAVKWEDLSVYVDISMEAVKNSPEYDPSAKLQQEYTHKLHAHYGKNIRKTP